MGAREVITKFFDNYAAGRIDEAFEDIDESFRFHWVAEPGLSRHTAKGIGRHEFRQRIDTLHDLYEYTKYGPTMIVAEGDVVAAQVAIDMLHRPTGRSMQIACADFWTVRNGRIVELIEYYDTALVASVEGPPV